jgi:spore coat protein CotF
MNVKKKIFKGLATAALATTLFTGCSKESPTQPVEEPTTTPIIKKEKPKTTTPVVEPITTTPVVEPITTPTITTPTILNKKEMQEYLVTNGFTKVKPKFINKGQGISYAPSEYNKNLEKILFQNIEKEEIKHYTPTGDKFSLFKVPGGEANGYVFFSNNSTLYEKKPTGSNKTTKISLVSELNLPTTPINNSHIVYNFGKEITQKELDGIMRKLIAGEHKPVISNGLWIPAEGVIGRYYNKTDSISGPTITKTTFFSKDYVPTDNLEIYNGDKLVGYLPSNPNSPLNTFELLPDQSLDSVENTTYEIRMPKPDGRTIGLVPKGKLTPNSTPDNREYCPEGTREFINYGSKPNTYNNCT